MICYDKKIKKNNINSLKAILKSHNRCMGYEDLADARLTYVEWCDTQLSDMCGRDMKYMDVVNKSYDWLQTISEWSGEANLRKINRYLGMIQPFTNYSIELFPVVEESR